MRMRRIVSPRGVVLFSGESSGRCGELVLSYNMPLTKVCVHCSTSVHVSKTVCDCRHVFASKKSSPLVTMKSERVVIDRRRSLESEDEIAARKAKKAGVFACDRACVAKKKALETQDEALHVMEHMCCQKESF